MAEEMAGLQTEVGLHEPENALCGGSGSGVTAIKVSWCFLSTVWLD